MSVSTTVGAGMALGVEAILPKPAVPIRCPKSTTLSLIVVVVVVLIVSTIPGQHPGGIGRARRGSGLLWPIWVSGHEGRRVVVLQLWSLHFVLRVLWTLMFGVAFLLAKETG